MTYPIQGTNQSQGTPVSNTARPASGQVSAPAINPATVQQALAQQRARNQQDQKGPTLPQVMPSVQAIQPQPQPSAPPVSQTTIVILQPPLQPQPTNILQQFQNNSLGLSRVQVASGHTIPPRSSALPPQPPAHPQQHTLTHYPQHPSANPQAKQSSSQRVQKGSGHQLPDGKK